VRRRRGEQRRPRSGRGRGRPADEQLGGDDRPYPWLVEQAWRHCADVPEELALELVGLGGCSLDPMGQAAQDQPRAEVVHARRAYAQTNAASLTVP